VRSSSGELSKFTYFARAPRKIRKTAVELKNFASEVDKLTRQLALGISIVKIQSCRLPRAVGSASPSAAQKTKNHPKKDGFLCERATKRIQNPDGFILQNGFTFLQKWVQI
jgi:hypothetical protein